MLNFDNAPKKRSVLVANSTELSSNDMSDTPEDLLQGSSRRQLTTNWFFVKTFNFYVLFFVRV